ncbi:MAG: hypothetical protein LBQ50_09090, partial [Planctomycetaceae bacterium]|nr:hypothetical protein [Planctomycetaceae bacterium]
MADLFRFGLDGNRLYGLLFLLGAVTISPTYSASLFLKPGRIFMSSLPIPCVLNHSNFNEIV